MNQPEDGVAGGHVLRNHADRQQIVHLIERHLGALLLLIDRVDALDAPFDAGLDVVLAQLLGERIFHAAQKLLAFDAPRFDGRRDLLVADRVGVAESQIFKLAAHLAHAQPMSQRRVDLQCLPRDSFLALRPEVFQGAHIVQPVGQLDQHHAHIGDHGQQHLAHIFRLAVLAIGKLNFVDIGDAFDDARNLRAEAGLNLLVGGGRVLDRVVQQAGGDGGRVHSHIRQHLGHLQRVDDVRLARGPHLPFMMADAELPGLADQGNVIAGAVGVDLLEKSFDTLVNSVQVEDGRDGGRRDGGKLDGRGPIKAALVHLRISRGSRERAVNLCRFGLPDSRHDSL